MKNLTGLHTHRENRSLADRRVLLDAARFVAQRAEDHAAGGRLLEERAARSLSRELMYRALHGSSLAEIEAAVVIPGPVPNYIPGRHFWS